MGRKIINTGPAFKRLKDTGTHFRRVNPAEVSLALGAQEITSYVDVSGSPLSLIALRQELARRLHSTGGRPALEGSRRRQKIPLTDEAWIKLEGLANALAKEGRRTTPGQVASLLLIHALRQVESPSSFSDIEKRLGVSSKGSAKKHS